MEASSPAALAVLRPLARGEGDGWANWSELATALADISEVFAGLLRRFRSVEAQRSAGD